jgi:hypothetical protein
MSKRRMRFTEFRAKVFKAAISGRKPLQETIAGYELLPIQVSQWKNPLLE